MVEKAALYPQSQSKILQVPKSAAFSKVFFLQNSVSYLLVLKSILINQHCHSIRMSLPRSFIRFLSYIVPYVSPAAPQSLNFGLILA